MASNRYEQYKRQKESTRGTGSNVATMASRTIYLDEVDGCLVVFPAHVDLERRLPINVSVWREFENVYKPLLKAFLAIHVNSTRSTVRTMLSNIETGLFAYLRDLGKISITLDEIDPPLINGFVRWLNQTDGKGLAKWSENTRARRFGTALRLLKQLKSMPEGEGLPDYSRIKGQWAGRHRRSMPKQGMSWTNYQKLYLACYAEVEETMRAFYETRQLIQDNREMILSIPPKGARRIYSDFGNALSAVDYYWPDHIFPGAKEFRRVAGESLYTCLPPFSSEVISRFCPTSRSIVPFVLLFAMQFSANAKPLLTARYEDFEEFKVLGVRRIKWKAEKKRATKDPERTYAVTQELDNPHRLLKFLLDYTEKLRESAAPEDRDKLFLFQVMEAPKVRAYHGNRTHGSVTSWTHPLKQFIQDNDLQVFTLSNIRQASLDRIDELFDGDIQARRIAGQHKSVDVTAQHYTSSNIKQKNHERLSLGISQRERQTSSAGLVDHRKKSGDRSSATPGYYCGDPFDSPLDGQTKGQLCTAYGRCPECPLALVKKNCSKSAAQVISLRLKISDAISSISPERFLSVWAPIVKLLDEVWIPSFSAEAIIGSKNVNLPDLPTIE